MIEYEKKVILSETEYLKLMAVMCKNSPSVIQTNYYFDTDDFSMNKKNITCRLRCSNNRYEAIIKNHNPDNTDCSIENTVEAQAEFDVYTFKTMGLHLQGSLTSKRTVAYKDKFCEMVLDMNTYLGDTDYELEIEYSQDCEVHAIKQIYQVAEVLVSAQLINNPDDFLNRIGKSKCKSQRFFDKKLNKS